MRSYNKFLTRVYGIQLLEARGPQNQFHLRNEVNRDFPAAIFQN